jgi:hypothetical protein
MRLLFIAGLGEGNNIFDGLITALPGEKVLLNLWELVPDKSQQNLNAAQVAMKIIADHHITDKDLVIGHSTGGWLALQIKQLTGCPIVQIASWTNPQKVIMPVKPQILLFAVATGLVFNRVVSKFLIKTRYNNSPSQAIFTDVSTRLSKGSTSSILNQLRLILNPVDKIVTVKPDLVLHSKGDQLVRCPDEPFVELHGDHFSLYTNPGEVYPHILDLIGKL